MSCSNSTKVFIVSMLAVPITYGFNGVMLLLRWDTCHSIWMVSSVILLMSAVCCLIVWLTKSSPPVLKPADFIHFCIFAVFSFTGVVTLITGLELDGIISGFMGAFLKNGEPYLRSAHGAMISYWNGTGMYAMYLMMIAAITWNNTFYEVALFWCGAITNSMVVLLLSVLTGKHGITWGSILYLPYVIIPPVTVFRLRHQKETYETTTLPDSLRHRPYDILFLLYLLVASLIAIFRALAVLNTNIEFVKRYMIDVEPYLGLVDPAPFPKMQMLVYLFYFLPIYIVSACGLMYPGCAWMPDLSLFHAGAALQAQISHLGASLHPRTPYILRVPPDLYARTVFWIINLILAVVPQLLAYRSMDQPDFFAQQTTVINKNGIKSKAN